MASGDKSSSRSRGRARARHGALRNAISILLGVVLALSLSIAFAHAESPEIEITECGTDAEGNPLPCEEQRTEVKPEREPSRPSSPSRARENEEHRYDLRSGRGSVREGGRKKEKDEDLDVDLSPRVREMLEEGRERKRRRPDAPEDSDRTERPPVSTSGGSALPGAFGAALASVSSDKALAQFSIPPFLMPIYVTAGRAYGIPWNILASINQIETNFGRNLNVSSAGAQGWMQFMPATWRGYGVDASGDGYADPYNPVDAIYAAARYLRASGGAADLQRAIFAYNHADWYVDQVLKTAGVYGSLPSELVGATSTLAYGRFPLLGDASYGDDFRAAEADGREPRGLSIEGQGGAVAVATQDVTVSELLIDRELASELRRRGSLPQLGGEPVADAPAPAAATPGAVGGFGAAAATAAALVRGVAAKPATTSRVARTASAPASRPSSGGLPEGYGIGEADGITVVVKDAAGDRYSYANLAEVRGTVRPGARLEGGQPIGELPGGGNPTLLFSVTTAAGVPIDPRPLVDGYRLQEATELSHAVRRLGRNPFVPAASSTADTGDPFSLPPGGGSLASQASTSGLKPGIAKVARAILSRFDLTITSTTGGNHVSGSWHYSGNAVDIAGPVPEMRRAAQWIIRSGLYRSVVEGIFNPDMAINNGQIVSPSFYSGTWAGHADHLHVAVAEGGLRTPGADPFGAALPAMLGGSKPGKVSAAQQRKLSRRLYKIANPHVTRKRSDAALRVDRSGQSEPTPTSALSHEPTAAGARVRAVATPPGGSAEAAWAIGTVDGAARPGWARRQVVLLARRAGSWRVAGPPRDRGGKVVNPALRAIAVARGGGGYAVGDRGAVVAFGGGSPRLLAAPPKTGTLKTVAAERRGGALTGIAATASGTLVSIDGTRVSRGPGVPGGASVTGTAASGDGGVLLAGAGASKGDPLHRYSGGSVAPVKTAFDLPEDTAVELSSVAERSGELWVAGSIADAGGAGGPRPFAAQRAGRGWRTYCSDGPAPAGVAELGEPTASACDGALAQGLASGSATAVAITRGGAVVAMPDGIEYFDGKSFRPMRAPHSGGASAPVSQLVADSTGHGWTVRGGDELGRIAPGEASGTTPLAANVVRLSAPGAATSAAVAVDSDGDRALTIAGGNASEVSGSRAQPKPGPGVPVRAAAVAGGDRAFAISDSGQLLARRGAAWSQPGAPRTSSGSGLGDLMLARRPLDTAAPLADDSSSGFAALAFRSPTDGYAVGRDGLIAHYDDGKWSSERGPHADLRGVAAGPGGVIAVGTDGTLVERDGDEWRTEEKPADLVENQDFSGAAALADGTLLALAGGSIVERRDGESWRTAPVAPLGVEVAKLAGYRDAGGDLHALALVRTGDGFTLLDGDAQGWRPLAMAAGFEPTDFAVAESKRKLWLAGTQGRRAATFETRLPSGADDRVRRGPRLDERHVR